MLELDTEAGQPMIKEGLNMVKLALKSVVVALLLVYCLHLVFVYIYFGALWNIEKGYPNLPVAVVNADQPFNGVSVGSIIAQNMVKVNSTAKAGALMFDWKLVQGDEVKSLQELEDEVFKEKYWVAVYIPPDFTSKLVQALLGLRKPYTNSNNISIIYDEGRQYSTIVTARTMTKTVLTQISYSISTAILSGQFGIHVNTSVADLSAVVTPIQVGDINLHPAYALGPAFSTYMGFIVMWLSALLVVNVIRKTTEPIERFWSTKVLVAFRMGLGFFSSMILSFVLTAIIWGFGLIVTMGYGAHFAFCWLAVLSFMTLISSIIALLGDAGLMLATLLLYVQIGSSSSIYSAELMNPFYEKIGPIFPIYHAVQGARTISFGSADHLSLNIGILFVWIIVCGASTAVTSHYKIKKRLNMAMKKNPTIDSAVKAVSQGIGK